MGNSSIANADSSPFGIPGIFKLPSNLVTQPQGMITTSGDAKPRRLFFAIGMLTSIYPIYLKLYDKATAPVVGTDIPRLTLPLTSDTAYNGAALVAAPSAFEFSFSDVGITFFNGIAYALTKLPADADTTAIIAGDVTGLNIGWV